MPLIRNSLIRSPLALALAGGLAAVTAAASGWPSTGAIAGWNTYVVATERRIARELVAPDRFLAQDFRANADANRRAVLSGEKVIDDMQSYDAGGREIAVPDAMVHHWR